MRRCINHRLKRVALAVRAIQRSTRRAVARKGVEHRISTSRSWRRPSLLAIAVVIEAERWPQYPRQRTVEPGDRPKCGEIGWVRPIFAATALR